MHAHHIEQHLLRLIELQRGVEFGEIERIARLATEQPPSKKLRPTQTVTAEITPPCDERFMRW